MVYFTREKILDKLPKELLQWTKCEHCNSYINSPNGRDENRCNRSTGHKWVTVTNDLLKYFIKDRK